MRNELRRHKKSDRVKWVIAFAAILLLAAGLTLICLQLFTPYKPSNGFKQAETDARVAVTNGMKLAGTISSGTGTATVHYGKTNTDYTVPFTWENEEKENLDGSKIITGYVYLDLSQLPENFDYFEMTSPATGWTKINNSTYSKSGLIAAMTVKNLKFTCDSSWEYIALPDPPTKEGYTFTGWYTDETCSNKYVGEMVRDDMTLYAGWQINRFTVTYDANGGTDCESVTVDWNTVPTLPTPERTGYNFVGWYDGDTLYEGAPIKENRTLTAHWEIMTFTVTFMSDGAVYKTVTVNYGTSLVEAMEEAEIASYAAYTDEGVRLSKQNSVITENTNVLVQDLSGWENYGDFVARSPWYTWLTVCVLGVLALTTVVLAIVIKKRG